MEFKKYNSIVNHYDNKSISRLLYTNPGAEDIQYEITEKIDGANFAVYIGADGSHSFARRNGMIGEDDNFMKCYVATEAMPLEYIKTELRRMFDNLDIVLYGELFGKGILGRINYGQGRYLRFYDLVINGIMQPPHVIRDVFHAIGQAEYLVPLLGYAKSFQEAIDWDVEIASTEFDDKMEGIVIKPTTVLYNKEGGRFIIKKKSEAFMETRCKKLNRTKVEATLRQIEFANYITESRLISVISKEGEPESPSDIGKYIKLLIDDAIEEFTNGELPDNNDGSLRKYGGRFAAQLIKERMGA